MTKNKYVGIFILGTAAALACGGIYFLRPVWGVDSMGSPRMRANNQAEKELEALYAVIQAKADHDHVVPEYSSEHPPAWLFSGPERKRFYPVSGFDESALRNAGKHGWSYAVPKNMIGKPLKETPDAVLVEVRDPSHLVHWHAITTSGRILP